MLCVKFVESLSVILNLRVIVDGLVLNVWIVFAPFVPYSVVLVCYVRP